MVNTSKCLVALAFVVLGADGCMAAGTAVDVDPEASIRAAGQQRVLLAGDTVEIGDLIQTAPSGHVELVFDDGTKIVVGPGSSLLIQDYLLRGDGSAGDFAVNALGGTYRFITGKSAKDRYKITTPAGTIGVRGTEFDLYAQHALGARVLMYSGATELCSFSGNCTVIADLCELGELSAGEASSLGLTTTLGSADRRELRSEFVYSGSQQSLSNSHKLYDAGRCLLSPFPGTSEFFARLGDQPQDSLSLTLGDADSGYEPVKLRNREGPSGVPSPKSVVERDEDDNPRPHDNGDDGDCAGNSDHNPGKSQNCTDKK